MGLTKILTMTLSQCCFAKRTRLKWPSWRQPMVGTSPTRWPDFFQASECCCISLGFSKICIGFLLERVLFVWEGAGLHFLLKLLNGVSYGGANIRKTLYELRFEVGVHAQNILAHQNLAVAIRARANSNGRNFQSLSE